MKYINRLRCGQRGFTIVELLVVIPIMAIVVAGATAGLITVLNSGDASTHMYSLRQVQQAGYWVSTDGYQAQEVHIDNTTGSLFLKWTDPDTQEVHEVTYTLGGLAGEPRTLERYEVIKDDVTGNVTSQGTTTVARYLVDYVYDPDSGMIIDTATEWRLGIEAEDETPLIFKVTAQVGLEPAEERTYNITLRPDVIAQVGL